MALIEKKPPQAVFQTTAVAVNKLMVSQHGGGLEAAAAMPPEMAAPHAVYTFGLRDIASGKLTKAKRVGWRYLVMRQDQAVAAAQSNLASGGAASFSHLNSGPFVAGTQAALEFAESLPQVKQNDFEVRLLSIPGLYQMAIWLHGKKQDLLVPVQSPAQLTASGTPNASDLQPDQAYDPSTYFSALLPHAQRRLQLEQSLEQRQAESPAPQPKGGAKKSKTSATAKRAHARRPAIGPKRKAAAKKPRKRKGRALRKRAKR